MFKLTIILVIIFTLLVTYASAESNNNVEEERGLIEQNEEESTSTDVGTSRVKHHHLLPFYGGSALLGFGGLHALAVLYAIKVKVIVVAFIIALSIYYYSKIYLAKSCLHGEVIRDTPPYESFSSHGPSGYSNSLPSDFSYSGPDPYSAYAHIHPDISSIDHLHHHATGFDDAHPSAFDHDHHHDHEAIPDSFTAGSEPGVNAAQQNSIAAAAAANSASAEQEKATQRIYNQMRQFGNPMFDNINWAEIAFQFLGVDSDGCRRRFTCELDFRVKGSPFTRFVFSMVSPKYFNKYRDLSKDADKPTSFADCARIHRECKEAEKYDQHHDDIEEVTEPIENGLNEESERQIHEPLGRLIIRRSEK